jgi:protease II
VDISQYPAKRHEWWSPPSANVEISYFEAYYNSYDHSTKAAVKVRVAIHKHGNASASSPALIQTYGSHNARTDHTLDMLTSTFLRTYQGFVFIPYMRGSVEAGHDLGKGKNKWNGVVRAVPCTSMHLKDVS